VLRNHGEKTKSNHTVLGYCNRLDNLQAAFLQIKLGHLPDWNRARRVAAQRYDQLLAGVKGVTLISPALMWRPCIICT
jgi:dTDP-3-amino-3,4,6-trideoxy-alpha-D-glucose transaminase